MCTCRFGPNMRVYHKETHPCSHLCTCRHTHVQAHRLTGACWYTFVHTCMNVHALTWAGVHIHVCTCLCVHSHAHPHVLAYTHTHAHMHSHTCVHTYMHTHTCAPHMYTHTHAHVCTPVCTQPPLSLPPGLAVGCREQPLWVDEHGTTVELVHSEQGGLPWL